MYLGKTPQDREKLSRYSQQLMEWGVADIGLYPCNVAAENNSEFMLRLHQLTDWAPFPLTAPAPSKS
ncbi:MAG: DUF4347 domain-containing protein [Hormoscilla sp.]